MFDKHGNEIKKKWYPDIERTKKNIHKFAVLENSTQTIKANFIINPEWCSETTHQLPPSPGRKHAPWGYEYPGARPTLDKCQEKIAEDMINSLKMKTPRV